MLKWFIFALAAVGLSLAVYTSATADERLPSPPPARPPSVNPFPSGVAASGIVEAASRNIEIAAPEPGLVAEVRVQVGDLVKQGDVLFRLDARPIEAELVRGEAALLSARARLSLLVAAPRAEDLPPLEAAVARAGALVRDAENQLEWARRASEAQAATESEIDRRDFALSAARAALAEAEARLALTRAGAWEADLAVARAAVASAGADLNAWRIRLDRLSVRSPVDATVLKRDIEPGEYASPGGGAGASLVVGDLSRLRVRAQVNEEDAPLLRASARGVARIRGVLKIELPLTMIRIEPLARAKRQITGAASELVDTRVVEVLFEADTSPMPSGAQAFPGQVVDVFIEAPARE